MSDKLYDTKMVVESESREKISTTQLENSLKSALAITEIAVNLRNNYQTSEKALEYLKNLLDKATTAVMALQSIAKSSLKDSKKIVVDAINTLENDQMEDTCITRQDFEILLGVINKQLVYFNELDDSLIDSIDLNEVSEKIKLLEMRKKKSDNYLPPTSSSRSVKCDIDEKYPENWSRDSLIDLNTVVNLPPVPEDIFSNFSSNKPTRSSSLSSLKSMRKVKLFLQKAENSEEDENSSDNEDQLIYGDAEEYRSQHSPSSKKLHLGNIKEETQDT